MTRQELVMNFIIEGGKRGSIKVLDPRTDLNPLEVKQAMDALILSKAILASNGILVEAHSAQIVTTNVSEYDIN